MAFKWPEEIDKILVSVITSGGGGLVVGVGRGIFGRYGGWRLWLVLLVASTLVGSLTGLALHDSGLSTTTQSAIIGLCSFLAEDILLGLAALSALFARDPLLVIEKVWRAIRGSSMGMSTRKDKDKDTTRGGESK